MKPLVGALLCLSLFIALGQRSPNVVDVVPVYDALIDEERALRARFEQQRQWPSRGSDPYLLGAFSAGVLATTKHGDNVVVDLAGGAPLFVESDVALQAMPSPALLAQRAPSRDRSHLVILGNSSALADEHVDNSPTHAQRVAVNSIVALHPMARRVIVSDAMTGAHKLASFEGALFSLAAHGDVIVVGGLEDLPLDRSGGSFGHIDSYVYGFAIGERGLERRFALNLSEHGVVTPKAIALDGGVAYVAGAGSGMVAIVDVVRGVVVDVFEGLVGASDAIVVAGHLVLASPVADALAVIELSTWRRRLVPIVKKETPKASPLSRLGELLVTSTMLAPEQSSDGPLSRFTCEACHRDFGSDGRVHGTGRSDGAGHEVVASTKPLAGLFQNAPLFSRAYDDSVSSMVHAEVRVANANTPRGESTTLFLPLDAPFVRDVIGKDELADVVDPQTQRRAMLHFFADLPPLTPEHDDDTVTPTAADWLVFMKRCASCHAPRRFADDASTTVDDNSERERQTQRRLLVWAKNERVDVGVRPLVREGGARVSSLRGGSRKRPLLTNGSARDPAHLLRRMRVERDGHVWHDGDLARGVELDDDEQAAIVRVLLDL